MAPRPRNKGHKDLVPNLYPKTDKRTGVVYYQYLDRRTGKFHGMGTDKAQANKDARALNTAIDAQLASARVAVIVTRQHAHQSILFADWITLYLPNLEKRGLKKNTIRHRKSMANIWTGFLKGKTLAEITTLDISGVLNAYRAKGNDRMAQAMRSIAIDIWNEAMAEGHATTNPAKITRNPRVEVKRARLTWETFSIIHAKTAEIGEAFAVNSQLLALVTAQRPEDLCEIQFRRGADWDGLFEAFMRRERGAHPYPHVHDGKLWVVQHKTGNLVRIPLTLRLDVLGLSVGDVVHRCRTRVASRFLLHHTKARTMSKPGDKIHPQTISKWFARARNATDLKWPMMPPTLYEIRSLAERLYEAQGVNTRLLLGHKDAKMTATYHDSRGAEWMEVEA